MNANEKIAAYNTILAGLHAGRHCINIATPARLQCTELNVLHQHCDDIRLRIETEIRRAQDFLANAHKQAKSE